MATITFVPKFSQQFVNWNDPTVWSGGVVPNDPSVDVVIPTTFVVSDGQIYISFITQAGSISVGSLSVSNNYPLIEGSLSVTNGLTLQGGGGLEVKAGGHASVGSLSVTGSTYIQGAGTVTNAGHFLNEGTVVGSGLNVTTSTLTNTGKLYAASGDLTVTTVPGGFTNLSGSTLTGGTYTAGFSGNTAANNLYLNIGGLIGTNAANISLSGGGAIYAFDDNTHAYVSIASSLHVIAAAGSLALQQQSYNWSNLTVDGSVALSTDAVLNTTMLIVDASGRVEGDGTLSGPIVNDGTIIAGYSDTAPANPQTTSVTVGLGSTLVVSGPVTGDGAMELRSTALLLGPHNTHVLRATLELGDAASSDVVFADSYGRLILDDPSGYTGTITPTGSGDQIVLTATSLASVTSYAYAGDSTGGTLTIHKSGGDVHLDFTGAFTTANFTLSVGPQNLSSDPPSLLITNTGSTALVGTSGNDTFSAPNGNWHFDALGGVDTINFGFRLIDATVSYSGNTVTVDGPSSHTVLTGFEKYVFTDGTVDNADGDVLVDDLFYYSKYHDVWSAQVDAELHYHNNGWHEWRDPSAFFSTSFYLATNADVKAAGVDPVVQFDQSGWQLGRSPSAAFNGPAYLAANPDVAAAHIDPLAHFLRSGAGEGRQPFVLGSLIASNGFDYVYYLEHNPDVAAAHVDPLGHFQTVGWKEGRNPNALFDTAGYLATYTDVKAAGINPVDHYNNSGWHEGRDPSVNFDTSSYLLSYQDVAAARVNPLLHFLMAGQQEGRDAFADGLWG